MKKKPDLYKALNRTMLTLAVISGLNSVAGTAWAARDDWRGHERDARAWHQQHWHNGRMIYGGGEPYVTYAPPLVVEPPPPAYYTPEPGISVVVPLHIR